MKKVILIFAVIVLSLSFTDCKKSSKLSATTDVQCIWVTNGGANGTTKYFYKCASTTGSPSEYQNECIKLRDAGLFHTDVVKSTCSECQ